MACPPFSIDIHDITYRRWSSGWLKRNTDPMQTCAARRSGSRRDTHKRRGAAQRREVWPDTVYGLHLGAPAICPSPQARGGNRARGGPAAKKERRAPLAQQHERTWPLSRGGAPRCAQTGAPLMAGDAPGEKSNPSRGYSYMNRIKVKYERKLPYFPPLRTLSLPPSAIRI